eukprot:TRINITY_DN23567_c0_g2_i1.p2 TRINITY_DN23567_c0_g2~~TRINITY_DN23567_c0_g2_i1.p2  ORF type:complete len:136 (-),score=20.64 TRINITY_DN23567_c0_g2_i1:721-1080(-)
MRAEGKLQKPETQAQTAHEEAFHATTQRIFPPPIDVEAELTVSNLEYGESKERNNNQNNSTLNQVKGIEKGYPSRKKSQQRIELEQQLLDLAQKVQEEQGARKLIEMELKSLKDQRTNE